MLFDGKHLWRADPFCLEIYFEIEMGWDSSHLFYFFPPNTLSLAHLHHHFKNARQTSELSSLGVMSSAEAVVCRYLWRCTSVRVSTYLGRGHLRFLLLLYSPLETVQLHFKNMDYTPSSQISYAPPAPNTLVAKQIPGGAVEIFNLHSK